jgi:hypothetical protein
MVTDIEVKKLTERAKKARLPHCNGRASAAGAATQTPKMISSLLALVCLSIISCATPIDPKPIVFGQFFADLMSAGIDFFGEPTIVPSKINFQQDDHPRIVLTDRDAGQFVIYLTRIPDVYPVSEIRTD